MSSLQQHRGVPISLITRVKRRYTGVLDDVDRENATISLTSVKRHGTEGRVGNPALEVNSEPGIVNYICFAAKDVEELSILKSEDPAILSQGHPKDFDFAKSNAKLHKDEIAADFSSGPHYNQSMSFFDSISCESLDRSRKRLNFYQEKKLNLETFGAPRSSMPRRRKKQN